MASNLDIASLLARAAERDDARRHGIEPDALEDNDILTGMDIAEIHEVAQGFRGDRVEESKPRSIAVYEVVVSRSEYVCMAEALMRLRAQRDALLAALEPIVWQLESAQRSTAPAFFKGFQMNDTESSTLLRAIAAAKETP